MTEAFAFPFWSYLTTTTNHQVLFFLHSSSVHHTSKSISMADRLRFDKSQLGNYFDRIALPKDERLFSVSDITPEKQLQFLSRLKKHHLITIAFENLTLHYSWHRVIDVSPRHLFNKIVKSDGNRGGYCMEVNSLFHTLLLSLGFNVFMGGARVYRAGFQSYGGFSHCVNIVTIKGTRYMVDVGFGANGPSDYLSLEVEVEHTHVQPARMRLVREPILQNANQDCKVWIYQHKINDEAEWAPMYCFVDFEFILEDIRCMNFSPWKSTSSWFTQQIVVTRFTTNRESYGDTKLEPVMKCLGEGDEIDGVLMIDDNKLKWRRKGATVLEKTLESEEERISALKKFFGIMLADEDYEAIKGTVGAIRS